MVGAPLPRGSSPSLTSDLDWQIAPKTKWSCRLRFPPSAFKLATTACLGVLSPWGACSCAYRPAQDATMHRLSLKESEGCVTVAICANRNRGALPTLSLTHISTCHASYDDANDDVYDLLQQAMDLSDDAVNELINKHGEVKEERATEDEVWGSVRNDGRLIFMKMKHCRLE